MGEHQGTLDGEIFAQVAEALRPLHLDRPALREVLRDLVEVGIATEIPAPPPDHRGVHPGRLGDRKWYAIHTKDLTQLGSIATALLAGLAGAGLAPGPRRCPRELRPGARAPDHRRRPRRLPGHARGRRPPAARRPHPLGREPHPRSR
ncbi:MAG: hypothetical protein R3F60_03785 [bacterium]